MTTYTAHRSASAEDLQLSLGSRWYPLRIPHEGQRRLWTRDGGKRFGTCHAARRGGKSEIAKRVLSKSAARHSGRDAGNYAYLAPTYNQAKRIAWEDLKALAPRGYLAREPLESELMFELRNGSRVFVIGMDKPARFEGTPWDGVIVDEYGDMDSDVWGSTIRPALETVDRQGWALLIGKPKGRNHWWRRCVSSSEDTSGDWFNLTWPASDIIGEKAALDVADDLDEQTYRGEMCGEFVGGSGLAYYAFKRDKHVQPVRSLYNPSQPLMLCLDFNVDPGIACVCQKVEHPTLGSVWAAIGEVWIERGSNTPAVIRRFLSEWAPIHKDRVLYYADASGGARHTSQVIGSDLDIVRDELVHALGTDRVGDRVPRSNPPERARVNAVNFALCAASGRVRFVVDPSCKHLIADLEGVGLDKHGQLDKQKDKTLTHMSDGVGYMLHEVCPPGTGTSTDYVQHA